MKRIAFILLSLSASVGCAASSPNMQSQVAEEQTTLHDCQRNLVKAKVETASSSFLQASADTVDAIRAGTPAVLGDASAAWDWTADHVSAAYRATEEKARACFQASSKNPLLTVEDYKALAVKCWNSDGN